MYRYIEGVNHCAKIARLSQCDTSLVRDAVAHLLSVLMHKGWHLLISHCRFYQTVLLIDIFQYSNIYALRRPLSWLATSKWVIAECGPYVSKHNDRYPDWPSLLEMYSHFGGGVSVSNWIDRIGDKDLEKVDVRRFVSFGVIKVGLLCSWIAYRGSCQHYAVGISSKTSPLSLLHQAARR